jgi:putative salt-induced outer membrane protein YdiY
MQNHAFRNIVRLGVPVIALALLSGLLPVAAAGATWTLLNGDRLSGELVTEFEDVIVIRHVALGLMEIPRSALAIGTVAAVDANAPVATSTPAATAVKAEKKKWKGQLEVGYTQQSGVRTQQNLTMRGQVDGRLGTDSLRGTARLLQTSSDGVRQSDRLDADFRWRHELTQRFFVQSLSAGFTDALRQIDLSLEEQVGVGWKMINTKVQTANLGLGVAVRRQEKKLTGGTTGLLGTLFQDYAHTWKGGLRFSEESSIALSAERSLSAAQQPVGIVPVSAGGSNYRLRFGAALQGRVIGRTIFNIRYDYDYDRSVLVPDYRADQRLSTSLGYIW